MAFSYGCALLAHGYAFVAAFAADVGLRREELQATREKSPTEALESVERGEREEAAKAPELAHAFVAKTMTAFAVEPERLAKFGLLLRIGSLLLAHWQPLFDWRVIRSVLFM
ncbi:exported protein of unknown function (plasmid) [Caballeronia sp. S22]